jgi:hypothetical protein
MLTKMEARICRQVRTVGRNGKKRSRDDRNDWWRDRYRCGNGGYVRRASEERGSSVPSCTMHTDAHSTGVAVTDAKKKEWQDSEKKCKKMEPGEMVEQRWKR